MITLAPSQGFIVLIGSYARGDQDEQSDCDVLFVDEAVDPQIFEKLGVNPAIAGPISFDGATFRQLYRRGSLFLQHCFREGVLIGGDSRQWQRLTASFQVKSSFRSEMHGIARNTSLLATTEIFGNTFLTPLSTAFSELKNACIFSLASRGIYEFNKHACLQMAVRDPVMRRRFEQLKQFYDYSVRSLPVNLPFDPLDCMESSEILKSVDSFVKEEANACC